VPIGKWETISAFLLSYKITGGISREQKLLWGLGPQVCISPDTFTLIRNAGRFLLFPLKE